MDKALEALDALDFLETSAHETDNAACVAEAARLVRQALNGKLGGDVSTRLNMVRSDLKTALDANADSDHVGNSRAAAYAKVLVAVMLIERYCPPMPAGSETAALTQSSDREAALRAERDKLTAINNRLQQEVDSVVGWLCVRGRYTPDKWYAGALRDQIDAQEAAILVQRDKAQTENVSLRALLAEAVEVMGPFASDASDMKPDWPDANWLFVEVSSEDDRFTLQRSTLGDLRALASLTTKIKAALDEQ